MYANDQNTPVPATRAAGFFSPFIRTILKSDADDIDPEDLDDQLKLMVEQELHSMNLERADMSVYRQYYESEQTLVYGSVRFRDVFGEDFQSFRDNWCAVVADALIDRLRVIGIRIGQNNAQQTADAREIWRILSNNDWDQQQLDAFEAAVVEGRAAFMVWPDPVLVARVDWCPPQTIRVRYADDDERVPVFAVHRWVTPSGEVWVNVITVNALYKYKEAATTSRTNTGTKQDMIADIASFGSLEKRITANEPWPLPNELGVIPVVELRNKRGSELKSVIPQQDALNYMIVAAMITGEFSALRQRVMMTAARAPAEGWSNKPGTVWRLPPVFDGEGRPMHSQIAEFSAADVGDSRGLIDMMLQHLALSSKTPVRYFFQSDRGGRGDAPSGESLKVEDGPLNSKIEDRQTRFGNGLASVGKLVKMCMELAAGRDTPFTFDDFTTALEEVEVVWRAPENHYRLAVLQEALIMLELGMPVSFVWKKLGLSPAEQEELFRLYEEAKAEDEEKARAEMELEKELVIETQPDPAADPANPPVDPAPTSDTQ